MNPVRESIKYELEMHECHHLMQKPSSISIVVYWTNLCHHYIAHNFITTGFYQY